MGRIGAVREKQIVLGASTAVLGEPFLTTAIAPIGRVASLLLGLLLGIAVALMVESATPKIVSPEDVEAATELPVLATVARAGIRKGRVPLVNAPFSLAAEGYRRVAAALLRHGLCDDIRVLAITSADPGEGKSTLAVNLGHALAARDGRYCLVLPAGNPSRNPGELLVTDKLRQMLITLRTTDITVLLDTPPAHFSADALTLAGVADGTVLVARSGISRWTAIQQAAEGFRRDQVNEIGAVLVGTRSLRPLGTLRYGYGYGYGDKGLIEAVQANDGKRQQRSQHLGANGAKPRERLGERSR